MWSVALAQQAALGLVGLGSTVVGTWLGGVTDESRRPSGQVMLRARRPFPGAGLRGLVTANLRRRLREAAAEADVAHVHLCRDYLTTSSVRILRRRGVTIVAQPHGMLTPGGGFAVRVFDWMFRRTMLDAVDLWLALTDREERDLLAFGVSADRISRISNAAKDLSVAHPRVIPGEPVFAFVGRLEERKQPDVFVAAAIKLLEDYPDTKFVIAGPDQGMREVVMRSIAASGRADSFDLLGPLERDRVASLLSRVTALVLPSRGEVAPMIVIEAAGLGVPSVLTTDCGLAADIDRASAGVVVAPEVEATRAGMADMLQSREYVEILGQRSRAVYLNNWSMEALATSLTRLYEHAMTLGREK
ncbi:glycosyltransferase [Demequina sp. SYSU T00039]|uniref:Glycosyltransferase n=1 Tax=Demequina lignilytica TaxID=3051663 RepID=A0AAW7M889_9MICO|nr:MULTISPECIES: glycosyltransferase [unclassified Demequina]MDN4477441.1 glycosyltransferase [Demequina sp. SYSU T00039-1]MDN4488208.1 glycosyltransferase [Demequina sp. SYSU T00039]